MSWRGEHHTPNRYRATSYLIKVRFILHSSFVFGLFHLLAWISVLWHNKYEFDPSLNQLPVHFAVSDALPSCHGRAAVRSYTYFNRKSIAYSSFYLKTLYVEVPKCCFYRHTQACYLLPRIEEMTVTAINAGTLPALSLHRTKQVISLSLSFSLSSTDFWIWFNKADNSNYTSPRNVLTHCLWSRFVMVSLSAFPGR